MGLLSKLTGVIAAAVLIVGGVSVTGAQADPLAPPGTPTAAHTASVPTAGPLFFGSLADGHGCSASVVHSPGHDLILTAAHCISGTGAGIRFAPGYIDGATPYGVWTTTRVWVSPRWTAHGDTQQDYAFLQVAPQRIHGRLRNVEAVTGANLLGLAPRTGTLVTDPAYPGGVDDAPITCTARITYTQGYPTFDCYGYFGGTSGSPFLIERPGRPGVVTGVIGGLHQGGCYDWNSFSSAFGAETVRTYLRAILGRRSDLAPQAGGDGC